MMNTDAYLLNSAQRRYVRLAHTAGEPLLNNITVSCWVDAKFDAIAVQRGLQAVMARHPLLRARVAVEAAGVQFLAQQQISSPLTMTTLGDTESLVEKVRQVAQELHLRPLSFFEAPMWRFHVFVREGRLVALVLCLNHLISDASSLRLILQDFASAYGAETDARLPGLALGGHPPDLQALAEAELLPSAEGHRRLEWNRSCFQDFLLGTTWDAGAAQPDSVGYAEAPLEWPLWLRLCAASKAWRVRVTTLAMLALARSERVLFGRCNCVVKTITANRQVEGSAAVVNNMFGILPVRVPAEAHEGALRTAADALDAAYTDHERNRLPYWYLVQQLRPELYLHPYGLSDLEVNILPVVASAIVDEQQIRLGPMREATVGTPSWPEYARCLLLVPFRDGSGKLLMLYDSHECDLATAQRQAAFVREELDRIAVA
ncbi:condensation domain-containing protein [Caldimonas brevitalea]|nr:condensation domain-containing protein [Caldimonas brevitalea]